MIIRLFILLALFACEKKIFSEENSFDNVIYIDNYDGDTVKVTLYAIHKLFGEKLSIRVRGIDTPEMRSKDICEKAKAIKARDFAKAFLVKGSITLKDCGRGKYFRLVCDVWVNAGSLGSKLIQNKLAVPYDGDKKPDVDWCK